MDGKENAECGDVAVRDKDDERKQFYGKIVADYRCQLLICPPSCIPQSPPSTVLFI